MLLELTQRAELTLMHNRSPDVPVEVLWWFDLDGFYAVAAVDAAFAAAPKLAKKPFTTRQRKNQPYISR